MPSQKHILNTLDKNSINPPPHQRLAITEFVVVDSDEYPMMNKNNNTSNNEDLDLDLDFDFDNIQLTKEEMLAIVNSPIIEPTPINYDAIANRNQVIENHKRAVAKEALNKAGIALLTIKQHIVTLTLNHIKYYDQDKSGVVYQSYFFKNLMEIKSTLDEILEKSFNIKPQATTNDNNNTQSQDDFTESKTSNAAIDMLARRSEFKTLWYSHKEKSVMIGAQATQLQNAIAVLNPLIKEKIDIEDLKNKIGQLLFIIDSAMNKFTNTLPFFTKNLVSSRLMDLNNKEPSNSLQRRLQLD